VREHVNERKKTDLSGLRGLVLTGVRPILGIILALMVSAGFILARGVNPIVAYAAMLQGAFGSVAALANTGVRAAPIILSGFAVGLGYKAGLWNIGGTGQIYLGATAATIVGIIPLPVPAWLHLLIAVIAGFIGGALWMLVPAYLCAYRSVNLVCTTLMLDYVAGFFVSWLLHEPSPLAEKGAFFPMSPLILPSARLPILVKGTSLHAGFVLAIVLGVILYFVLYHTPFGFRTRMVGENPEAARYAGVNVVRWILLILLICGGMAGLAGAGEVLGLKLRLFDYFEGYVGFEGLALAIMVEGSPLGMILAGIFFGSLKAGAGKMQIVTGIGSPMAVVIEALAVLFVVAIGFGERGGFTQPLQKRLRGKEG
jgi:ABC-type uncharacterized transport system permease subunit